MEIPLIIAFEMSSYEDDAFPVAVAWTLTSGQIKSTLICPEAEWLERLYDQGGLDIDPDQLLHEGHSAKAVLEELHLDLGDEALYCCDTDSTAQALEMLMQSLDREYDINLRPAAELLIDSSDDEREFCRQECLTLLGLDQSQCTDQVRLWLEMLVRLKS